MKKAENKKHHFVPKTYLKNFATRKNDDYYLNILKKDEAFNMIVESKISEICAEKHLLKPDRNDKSKQKLEDIYTDIFENHYDNLFSVLTDDKVLEITDELKKSIVSAVVTMFYKTKKWNDLLGYHTDVKMQKIDQLRNQFKVDHYFNSEGAQVGFQNKTLEELEVSHKNITRIPLLITQLKVALKLIEAKQFDCINVYTIADDSEFITSDNPVLAINMQKMRTMHFDIENAYYLPISNKYLIAIFPKDELPTQNKIIRLMINKEWVESFNTMQLFQSDKCIIGSVEAIKNTKEN
ncbi:MAG: DUF4238 domain-containing protein [Bacteroidales bacterium]|nr:DUF4238 domain-containing protein [Bacteroidales bacterium]